MYAARWVSLVAAFFVSNASCVSAAGEAPFPDTTPKFDASRKPDIVPNTFLVELIPGTSLSTRDVSHGIRALHDHIPFTVRHQFTNASLFYGVSITTTVNATIANISSIPNVKKVWPVFNVKNPRPVHNITSQPVAAAFGFNQTVIRPKGSRLDATLKMTGVDRLHQLGIKGKGMKIAMIDSGVDYRHPSLGKGFGPGHKISFGANLIANEDPNDPLTTCPDGGHGTHVSGIIGAVDADTVGFGLYGVAPDAELGMFKIFDCSESGTTSDMVLQAMSMAATSGADIISMSLGITGAFETLDPFTQMVTSITDLNIPVVVGAGNDGAFGPYTGSYPGISKDSITIASVDSPTYPITYKGTDSLGNTFTYAAIYPLMASKLHVWAPTSSDVFYIGGCYESVYQDAAAFADANGWKRSETVLLIQEGYCSFDLKWQAAVSYSFNTVINYDEEVFSNPFFDTYTDALPYVPYLYVIAPDGPAMYKSAVADPLGYTLSFSDRTFAPYSQPSAGKIANYSTFGPSWEMGSSKPTIGAPGNSILSTWVLDGGGYGIISGTSMATPFAAGVIALLKSKFPHLTARELATLIATSGSNQATFWANSGVLSSVAHQGGGLIDAWAAYNLAGKVKVSTTGITFPGSSKPVTGNFTITNIAKDSQTYSLTHVPAGMAQFAPGGDRNNGQYGFQSFADYAQVTLRTSTISIDSGQSETVFFDVVPPTDQPTDANSVYSGYIVLKSETDIIHIPYQGRPYTWKEAKVIRRGYIKLYGNAQEPVVFGYVEYLPEEYPPTVYANQDVMEFNMSDLTHHSPPYFYMHLAQITQELRVDIINASTKFTPTYYGYNPANIITNLTDSTMPIANSFLGINAIGTPLDTRGISDPEGEGAVWASTTSAADYRWLVRALRWDGNASDPTDWESWLSGVVRVTASTHDLSESN